MFKGTATALITPFTHSGIDFEALDKIIEYQLDGRVNCLVVLGTTGEATTMTQSEKIALVKAVIDKVKGKLPVIVGAGANSTASAVDNARVFSSLGADGLLVVTPYYNKCTGEGLVAHYSAVAKATPLPIICYNVPSRTGVNMLPQTFAEIVDKVKNVVAIKEASGNMEQIEECIRLTRGKADVISGDDGLTVPVMLMGGTGVISVASNIAPAYVSKMTDFALKGKVKEASDMQLKLLPLVKSLFCEVNPIPVKKGAELLGLCNGKLRLPLTEMTEQNALALKALLKDFA
jgi:4-hydroxy-tetrahydrodipicolinate synthase